MSPQALSRSCIFYLSSLFYVHHFLYLDHLIYLHCAFYSRLLYLFQAFCLFQVFYLPQLHFSLGIDFDCTLFCAVTMASSVRPTCLYEDVRCICHRSGVAPGLTSWMDGTTGLSQGMADTSLHDPRAQSAHCPDARTMPRLSVPLADLSLFLDSEVFNHFELTQAAAATDPKVVQAPVSLPTGMRDLLLLLAKLGYRLSSHDPWAVLGLGGLCGPEPTERDIAMRARTASLLLSLAEEADWSTEDRNAASQANSAISAAATKCEKGLIEVRRARRQLHPDKLPRWKELGADALAVIRDTQHADTAVFITQWSQVLDPQGPHAAEVSRQRRLADFMDKGDAKVLSELQGQTVVAWAPADIGALSRILAHFARRDAGASPAALLFVAPLPSFQGVASVAQYLDLWSHPLLGEKHAALVKEVSLLPQPVEFVLPGAYGPRHVRQGLACFRVACVGARTPPTVVLPRTPLAQVSGTAGFVVDLPPDQLPVLLHGLSSPDFQHILPRDPVRSPGNSTDLPRIMVRLLLPAGLSALGAEVLLRRLRRQVLSVDMLVGNLDLYTSDDALVLECHSPAAFAHARPLCSEAIFLTADRLLVRTAATAETWIALMDRLCKDGELTIISKLRWKSSRFGGRPFAVPTATSTALAATRRRNGKKGRAPQPVDFVTEVRVNGEAGLQDRRVFDELMSHVCQNAGLQLHAFDAAIAPTTGVWKHLASYDATAPPGRARLYLSSQDEVCRVHAALHGQMVQVGVDWLAVTVHNDILDAAPLAGNGGRML